VAKHETFTVEIPDHSERVPMFKMFNCSKQFRKENLFEHSEHIEQPPATFRQWRRNSVRITRLGGGAVMTTIPSTYPESIVDEARKSIGISLQGVGL
jgi:hypothetical protein